MARHLEVWLHGDPVGRLTQTDAGRLEFRYGPPWIDGGGVPLSLSLPLSTEPFGHRESEPFFGGLLPEEGVRDRVARYLGVSSKNDFALLEQIGGECAGAVALVPVGETPWTGEGAGVEPPPLALEPERLAKLLEELPRRPLLAGGERRLSLAGAQDKIAVSLVDGEVAIPGGHEPTTHILKVPIQGFECTVGNELLCMRTAAHLGLRVARAERRVVLQREFLLVERFDRVQGEDGRIQRVHQEDFCQALGVPTRLKYQSEGGPSLGDCFGLLTKHARRPAVDRLALMRATLFNVLVGNADAHAKNFSLTRGAELSLAPLYDLLSTLVYEDLSPRYAMKIGSKGEFKDLRPRHWETFADQAGLSPALVRRELKAMAAKLPEALFETASSLDPEVRDHPVVAKIQEDTVQRCELTEVRLKGD